MKNNKFLKLNCLCIAAILLAGCSDQFLEDKRDFSKTTEDIYETYEGSKARVDNLYALMLPESTSGMTYEYPSGGTADVCSQSTEEYSSFSVFVDGDVVLETSSSDLPDFFFNEAKTSRNPYGRIRNCNDAIEGISKGPLPKEQKDELLGQALFFRAWAYYRLVKTYGGVPIITEVQNSVAGDDGGLHLVVPRSTTKECIDFICKDLEDASTMLEPRWDNANYGRITSGAALALQGRARLLYASPLFNRSDNIDRWQLAYESNKAAITELKKGNFGLAYLDAPGVNASGWAKMFSDYESPEAVFVKLYNYVKEAPGIAPNKNNTWENSLRPKNTGASNGRGTTDLMVDLFPMADGKRPGLSSYAYNPNLFMLDRDPRFYRTFAFPGVRWAFSGDPTSKGVAYPYRGENYELWNYAWYENAEKLGAENQSGYAADGLGTDYRGVYIRKRTDDYDVNKNATLYVYDLTNGTSPFQWSAAPFMEMRYAEVLLNFAEAACGIGQTAEAIEALQEIRKRVGYTSANNYGLDADLTDRAKLFAAILYERQIELAYEGKRFDDMRRWMLWDGGDGQAVLKPEWALTGFGGNTCVYLGLTPFNQKRRDGLELRVADAIGGGVAEAKQDKDPIKSDRPAAWNLTTQVSPSAELIDFYQNKLTRKKRQGDKEPDKGKHVSFKPQYYFIGLKKSAQTNNAKLQQTIGWQDVMNGNAMGTFDPLAE